mmetsp:Transcript_25110/g.57025  ORF Transcript_25110/g.57025 Transcript_25110/m.57025 type:complete len:148 (+) Transcript_25110:285-728(+)
MDPCAAPGSLLVPPLRGGPVVISGCGVLWAIRAGARVKFDCRSRVKRKALRVVDCFVVTQSNWVLCSARGAGVQARRGLPSPGLSSRVMHMHRVACTSPPAVSLQHARHGSLRAAAVGLVVQVGHLGGIALWQRQRNSQHAKNPVQL